MSGFYTPAPPAPAPAPGPDEPPPPYTEAPVMNTATAAPQPQSRGIDNTASNAYPSPPSSTSNTPFQNNQHATTGGPHPPPSQTHHHQSSFTGVSGAPGSSSHTHIFTYPIEIRPNSIRTDFPYPQDWAPSRNISPQDWETFTGFLLPDGQHVVGDAKGLSPERRRVVETTINEWNEGFFAPRGVRIFLEDGSGPMNTSPSSGTGPSSTTGARLNNSGGAGPTPSPVPGPASWNSPHQGSSFSSFQGPGRPNPHSHTNQPGAHPGAHNPPMMNQHQYRPAPSKKERLTRKLKEKDVSWSSDTFRVGDKVRLGLDGIKIGSLNVDEKGVKYGDRSVVETSSLKHLLGQEYRNANSPSNPNLAYGGGGPGGPGGHPQGQQFSNHYTHGTSPAPAGSGFGYGPPSGSQPPMAHGGSPSMQHQQSRGQPMQGGPTAYGGGPGSFSPSPSRGYYGQETGTITQ